MVICIKCGQANSESDAFCGRCGAFLEWTGQQAPPEVPPGAPPAVTPVVSPPRPTGDDSRPADRPVAVALSTTRLKVDPGGQASLTVEIRNRGRTVDQLAVEVRDAAAAWCSVDPPSVNLLPDTTRTVTVGFSPPRSPSVPAGAVPFSLAVRSHEHPDADVLERGTVEVGAYTEYETELSPSLIRAERAAAATLKAVNRGNVPLVLALEADDPETALRFRLSPTTLRVAPGASAEAAVQITPRSTFRSGPPRTRPFRVLATSDESARRTLDGTFVQLPASRRRWPWALVLGLAVLGAAAVAVANPFQNLDLGFLTAGGGSTPAAPTAGPVEPSRTPVEPSRTPAEPNPPTPAGQPPAGPTPTPTPMPTPEPATWWQAAYGAAAERGVGLGQPTAAGTTAENLRYQEFDNGAIVERLSDVYALGDAIFWRWKNLGGGPGPAQDLGYPLSQELGPDAEHRRQLFDTGAIYWTPATDARAVTGAVWAWWVNLVQQDGGDIGAPDQAGLVDGYGHPTDDSRVEESGWNWVQLENGCLGVEANGTGHTAGLTTIDGQPACLWAVIIDPVPINP